MSVWTSSRSEAGCSPDWQTTLARNLASTADWSPPLHPIVKKLATGQPLNVADGLLLYNHADLNEVGSLAHHVRTAHLRARSNRTADMEAEAIRIERKLRHSGITSSKSLPILPAVRRTATESSKHTRARGTQAAARDSATPSVLPPLC